jgi:hypothetical protein
MQSWGALLLADLGRSDLARAYKFDEPWDGPNNENVQAEIPTFYCPNCPPTKDYSGQTNYLAITGPHTLFPGDRNVNLADVTDGLKNTILLVEAVNSFGPEIR